jgi:4-hydroxy-3-polyprenylbenzoate decarboxylase
MPHDGDGGRYLGTWHLTACKDPDSDWVNWGLYRHMIHNRKTLGCLVIPHQHIGRIFYEKYEDRNKPMEVAIALGTEPLSTVVAATDFPYGVSEVNLVGALRKEPLEVVKCETVDLYVPATSEIVIEGIMPPRVRVDEGPFGEYTGYRASPRAPRPIIQVTAITHRNDPILTYACMGMPVDEGDIVCSIGHTWDMRTSLKSNGLPITGIYSPPESAQLIVFVSTKTPYKNIAAQIASGIWATKGAGYYPMVVVVNEDVDVTNLAEVMHALCSKCHPVRGITVIPHAVGSPLLPMLNLEERIWSDGSKAVFDCTWPIDWPPEIAVPPKASFNAIYPERTKQKVLENWKNYGFKD